MSERHMKKVIQTLKGKGGVERKAVLTYTWVEKYGWKLLKTEPYEGAQA